MIMKTGQIPAKDACFQCYHPPVFYFTSAKIGEAIAGLGFNEGAVRKSLQFVNCFYNILTLVMLYLILQRLSLSPFSKVISFGIICFLPRHIYMSAMHSNDNLAYLFVAICTYLLLVTIEKKLTWLPVALLSLALSITVFVKYTAFVVLPMAAFSLTIASFSKPVVSRCRAASTLAVVLLPALLLLGVYTASNFRNYGNPFPWNAQMFDTSKQHPHDPEGINFVSFTPWQYIAEPLILPGQMHSFRTLIYSGTWFDTEPKFIHVTDKNKEWWPQYLGWLAGVTTMPSLPAPLIVFTRSVGAGLVGGGLAPLSLLVAGGVLLCRRFVTEARTSLQRETIKLTMFPILLASNICGIILLALKAPMYSSIKSVYLLNSIPAFGVFVAFGIQCIEYKKT